MAQSEGYEESLLRSCRVIFLKEERGVSGEGEGGGRSLTAMLSKDICCILSFINLSRSSALPRFAHWLV